jgi:hypothetical protein
MRKFKVILLVLVSILLYYLLVLAVQKSYNEKGFTCIYW